MIHKERVCATIVSECLKGHPQILENLCITSSRGKSRIACRLCRNDRCRVANRKLRRKKGK